MVLPRLTLCFLPILIASTTLAASFDLTPGQAERIQKYLPRTYPKLLKREPVHAVCIGDSVMLKYGYDQDNGNVLKAWNGVFLQELADQFIYNGGVRMVKPGKGQPEKLFNFDGPEITIQNFSRGGRQIFHALQPLTTTAFENKPDLVIVSYGINDSVNNLPLSVYRRSIQEIVDLVKAKGADLILCGPSMILSDPPEQGMALTRPYADTMREVAESNGVFFADLGDLTWLVQVEDRKHPLDELIKKRAADDAAAAAAAANPAPAAPVPGKGDPKKSGTDEPPPPAPPAPAPKPVLENPIAADIDPDPDKKAMVSFQQVVELMKGKFDHGVTVDVVHPDTTTSRVLGRRVFQELISGPKAVPWAVGTATLAFDGADKAVLTYRLDNTTPDEQTYTLLPLVTRQWKPVDAPSQVTLKGDKKTQVTITYARSAPADAMTQRRGDLFPSHEPFLRLPILTVGGGMVRVQDVRATMTPVAVLWNSGTFFNQGETVELDGWVYNTINEPAEGKWEATWMGQKVAGTFKAAGRSQSPFKVKLKMPDAAAGTTRVIGTLGFAVTVGTQVLQFDREVEAVRNIALKETLPLVTQTTYVRDKVPQLPTPNGSTPGVAFRADADSNAFFLTYDIYGYNLQDDPAGSGALDVDINIDARSYGKRLTPGTTDAVRITANAADGDAVVSPLPAWCFGTGYGMYYDEKQISAKLSSRPDGARRLTVMIPRGYLYLHEWAMGNGNSQLGINTIMALWQPGEGGSASGASKVFAITMNGRHRDDAESLAVLELTDKGTNRWTVRCY